MRRACEGPVASTLAGCAHGAPDARGAGKSARQCSTRFYTPVCLRLVKRRKNGSRQACPQVLGLCQVAFHQSSLDDLVQYLGQKTFHHTYLGQKTSIILKSIEHMLLKTASAQALARG